MYVILPLNYINTYILHLRKILLKKRTIQCLEDRIECLDDYRHYKIKYAKTKAYTCSDLNKSVIYLYKKNDKLNIVGLDKFIKRDEKVSTKCF